MSVRHAVLRSRLTAPARLRALFVGAVSRRPSDASGSRTRNRLVDGTCPATPSQKRPAGSFRWRRAAASARFEAMLRLVATRHFEIVGSALRSCTGPSRSRPAGPSPSRFSRPIPSPRLWWRASNGRSGRSPIGQRLHLHDRRLLPPRRPCSAPSPVLCCVGSRSNIRSGGPDRVERNRWRGGYRDRDRGSPGDGSSPRFPAPRHEAGEHSGHAVRRAGPRGFRGGLPCTLVGPSPRAGEFGFTSRMPPLRSSKVTVSHPPLIKFFSGWASTLYQLLSGRAPFATFQRRGSRIGDPSHHR